MKLTLLPICSRTAKIFELMVDPVRPPQVSLELQAPAISCMLAWFYEVCGLLPSLLVQFLSLGALHSRR
jgi:hypothetical protein